MSQSITVRHCSIYDVPRAGINIGDGCWGGHVIEFCDVFDTVKETGDHGSFNSWGRDRYWGLNGVDLNTHRRRRQAPRPAAARRGETDRPAQQPLALRPRLGHRPRRRLDQLSHLQQPLPARRHQEPRRASAASWKTTSWSTIRFIRTSGSETARTSFGATSFSTAYKPIRMPKPWGKECDFNLLPDAEALRKPHDLGMDEHSLAGDALFVNPAKGDYRVKDDSPALKLGFENFPMDQFGVTSPPSRPGPHAETSRRRRSAGDRGIPTECERLHMAWGQGQERGRSRRGVGGGASRRDRRRVGRRSRGQHRQQGRVEKGRRDSQARRQSGQGCRRVLRLYYAAGARRKVKLGVWRDQKDAAVAIERGRQIVLHGDGAGSGASGLSPSMTPKKTSSAAGSTRKPGCPGRPSSPSPAPTRCRFYSPAPGFRPAPPMNLRLAVTRSSRP